MLFNTQQQLWESFAKSSAYQPLRISPQGEVFAQNSGSIIGRFSTKEEAIKTIKAAGWLVGDTESNGYSGAIFKRQATN